MHTKVAVQRDIYGNGSGSERNGVCEGHPREVALQLASEFNDPRVNEVHHPRVKSEVQYMKVGQEDLIEKPRNVEDKSDPRTGQSGDLDTRGFKQEIRRKISNDCA